jgi:hypothetical protein
MDYPENQKTTIEILSKFAGHSKRKIFFSEIPYPGTVLNAVTNHKRTLYIPNNFDEQSFLIGYHDPKSLTENELYFGVFFPLSIPTSKALKIRKRDFLDKLNPFLKKMILKTNWEQFDSLTVISGNDISLLNRFFNINEAQKLVLESLKIMEGINVGINEFNLDFVPAFKDKSNFGVFTKQKWIVDSNILENLFTKIEQFRELITEKLIE